ncbi:uncharacterized protein LOC111695473 [Eurytemora carolleeae]|uniref:uncharacterized protein LOC111695473 n=1 Tax=Eurytemora carolleeae TaxID=1294199 RepID=UPI000C764356|nr:uncharacterized protein LOC111695473 [Eurytemora carolleeae]|eukprot:XP_023320584.1 uncharacterized protein LOC111695473 [Eurytemora affinis]
MLTSFCFAGQRKKRRNMFRSNRKPTAEEKVISEIWKSLKKLPCKKSCGSFSPDYQDSLSEATSLFADLETTEKIDNDLDTFMKIIKGVIEEMGKSEEVNSQLIKTAYIKALKNRNDTEGVSVDPASIFPSLRTTNIKERK